MLNVLMFMLVIRSGIFKYNIRSCIGVYVKIVPAVVLVCHRLDSIQQLKVIIRAVLGITRYKCSVMR